MNISLAQAGAATAAAGHAANPIDLAFGKAKTAALSGMRSAAVDEFRRPGSPAQGLELSKRLEP